MKSLDFGRYALCASMSIAMLAGCGGSQPPIGAPGAMQAKQGAFLAPLRVHEATAVERVIYSFAGGTGSMADGTNPRAGLVNVNGTLYGTTFIGGDYSHRLDFHGFGTVFSVTPQGTETVLHRFVGRDGRYPDARLIDVKGTFYGTTEGGGRNGKGTVFSITPNGTEMVLHKFKGGVRDGWGPEAGLTDVNGTLYGTTEAGGSSGCDGEGCGTVFSITTSGKETVIHSFGGNGDGVGPFARLLNVKGTLYGTTYYGPALGTYGIVFKITPSGKETVLHTFKGGADGAEPWADLINVNGTLYGTTSTGGVSSYCEAPGCGTVFSITPSGKEKVLYSFKGGESDGAGPEAGLTDVNGMLYGTTAGGGTHGCGTIFSMTTSGAETWTYSFCSSSGDGVEPDSDLIDVNGTLYGTTVSGGTYVHYGTVYSLTGL